MATPTTPRSLLLPGFNEQQLPDVQWPQISPLYNYWLRFRSRRANNLAKLAGCCLSRVTPRLAPSI